jgi:uncharacterized protein
MRLTDDRTGSVLLVRSYAPGEVRVADSVLQRSFLISAERLVEDWRPQTLDELTEADLEPVFALQPEIVVLGSGPRQRFPEPRLLAAIMTRGIGCEVMDTGAACRTYNVLVSEGASCGGCVAVEVRLPAG